MASSVCGYLTDLTAGYDLERIDSNSVNFANGTPIEGYLSANEWPRAEEEMIIEQTNKGCNSAKNFYGRDMPANAANICCSSYKTGQSRFGNR